MKYNIGGMYQGNTIPDSMLTNTNEASYEQVDQQRIDAANRMLQTIEANPWQQRFSQEMNKRNQQAQSLFQGGQQGLGLLTDRLDAGKNLKLSK